MAWLIHVKAAVMTIIGYKAIWTHTDERKVNLAATVGYTVEGIGEQFTLEASSEWFENAPTYQWQTSQDGTEYADIAGATGDTYTDTLTEANNGYYYRVVATSTDGTAVSDAVRIAGE